MSLAVTGKFPPSKQLEVYTHPNWFWWATLVCSKTLPGATGPLKNIFIGCVLRFLLVDRRLVTRNLSPAVVVLGFVCLTSCLGFFFCKVAWQKRGKYSRAFVFVMAKVTKTTSFLPCKTSLLQNITFCNKPPGFPEEPGNCVCFAPLPSSARRPHTVAFPDPVPATFLLCFSSLLESPKP